MQPQRSSHDPSEAKQGSVRNALAVAIFVAMLLSPIPSIAPVVSSDPGIVDNGDYTKSVFWNFTNPSSYTLSNTTISGGLGLLEFVNETASENSTAEYLLGARTNIDLLAVPDAMTIDNTSLTVQTLMLQPGPEGIDCYMDEWFPGWNPDGLDLDLSPQYDPVPSASRRCRIVMQFDLSSIPAGATIVNATILLYETSSKGGTILYSIHALNHSFDEQAVSWRNEWMTDGGDFSTEAFSNGTVDNANGWHAFDLTRLVDLWARGATPNYGFIIVPRDEDFDGTKTFATMDTSNKIWQRPKFVVNYTFGNALGTYDSRPLGPGTNATFTLASWGEGTISKVTDEFNTGSISSRWEWTKDPSLEGGSVNFNRPGWLNITGSQPTQLTNASVGCNYLHQTANGDFRAETSLQKYFSTDTMGAGLLMKSDNLTWLAIYASGTQGSGTLVAKVCKGGVSATLGSVPWTTTTAFLRIDRTGSTYQLLASSDGASWSGIASYAPVYDFTQRVMLGLCVFSGGAPSNPTVEFDFFRMQPIGQSMTFEMRVRTGNSTNLADPSWQPWGAPVGPSAGTVIDETGKYVQYRVTLASGWSWLSPLFLGFVCHYERHLPEGFIMTQNVYPVDLSSWETMTVTQSTAGGDIEFYYSTDGGTAWQPLGSGSIFSLSVTEPSMMLCIIMRTFDTLTTPSIDTIELLYSMSIASFTITVPATVQAGDEFPITIEARDPSNNTATGWNGTITLQAMDTTGVSNASGELYITQVDVPLGGVLTFWNQRYDLAETIRIRVSAGTVRGLSDPIIVQPGPAVAMTLTPDNTTMFEHTSEPFTATAYDVFGNVISGAAFTWTAEPSLGILNTTQGNTVLLTAGDDYTGGYLNVTCSGVSVSRHIDVLPTRLAPVFTSGLPGQFRVEDSGEWTIDISGNVSDAEDPLSKLKWYTTNESIVEIRGENRTGNLVITLSTMPDMAGSADLNVVVVDSDGMKATTTLHVEIEPVNDPPTIDPIDPLVVHFGVSYVFDFTPYLHDPDDPTYRLNLSIDSLNAPYLRVDDQYISFTYPESMVGSTRTVVVTVRDWAGNSSSTAVLVKVTDDQVPVQSRMLPNVQLNQGATLEDCAFLPDHFYDPDGDVLSFDYDCAHCVLGISLDGYVNVTAPNDWYGVEYAIIRAIDPFGARAEGMMQISVLRVNHPPVIKGVPDLKVRYGEQYEFDLAPYVSDLDEYAEELIFTASDLHCTFSGSVMIVLYPIGMDNTVNPVTITVMDAGYSSSCLINISVSANYPPELLLSSPLQDHSFQEDNPTNYPMEDGLENHFLDEEDGQNLQFVAFSLDTNITVTVYEDENSFWKVEFQTTPDYYGTSEFVIRGVDSVGAIVERTVTLEVIAVPDAPKLNLPPSFTVIEGQQVILGLGQYVADPDSFIDSGDFSFSVQILSAADNAQDYANGISALPGMLVFEYPDGFMKDHDKEFTIEVFVTDQTGKTDSGEIIIVLAKAPSDKGEESLLLTAAILATIGGVSGMGVVAWVRRKKPFVIQDMMLVHNDGFLIGRYAGHSKVEGEIDQDILSGMLTAVLNFVEDSMSSSHESLKTFGFKDYQVLVKRGAKSFAAVVFTGDLPDNIEKPVNEFLSTFERVYKKKITSWTGDIDTDFAGVELLIQSFVKEHSKKRSGNAGGLWVHETENGKESTK